MLRPDWQLVLLGHSLHNFFLVLAPDSSIIRSKKYQ